MRTMNELKRTLAVMLLAAMAVAAPWQDAAAQTTTGIIRGFVTDAAGNPVEGATVIARSAELNAERGAVTNERGFYALPGLRPSTYQLIIRRIGLAEQTRTVQLLVGQTLTIDFRMAPAAAELEAVVVTAAPSRETRTSEIATNVTREQIDELPSSDRNFLDLAALAPGVQLQANTLEGMRKTFTAGAQPAEQVNVFVDGASYKNDLLQGGVLGQDASRGNPFPRSAVEEFRILTQNFKAEYEKAASAIITATTRSGGATWEGGAFFNAIPNNDFIELNTFQARAREANPSTFQQPDLSRYQFGINGGGPLGDRVRVFGSYELNDQNRADRVSIVPPSGFPALDTVNFAQYSGEFPEPFLSHLYFGKLTFDQSPTSTFELSYSGRMEDDVRDFGGLTAYTAAVQFENDVHTGTLKHLLVRGDWVNEAFASYQYYNYQRVPNEPGAIRRLYGFGCCAIIGADNTFQDFLQKRLLLRDNLTWTGWNWLGAHVVKAGVNVAFADYDIEKRNSEVPTFVYEPWFNDFEIPQRVEFQFGDPNFGGNNTQFGVFIQDDWSPTSQLTINLGVRWDYETAMMNYDWVTPDAIVDSLTKYQDSLYLPLDPDRYFSTGDNRDPFLGAIQPRLGFSYAIDNEGRTTLFGGYGIYYDRNIYDIAIEEQFALQHPGFRIEFVPPGATPGPNQLEFDPRYLTEGLPAILADIGGISAANPEVKLIPNDLEPPMSQQFSAGVRQVLGASWLLEAAYNGVRSRNVPTFYFANMNFTCTPRTFACFDVNNIPGYSTILLMDDRGKTWYDALAIKIDRPYQLVDEDFGWGFGLAYTFANRATEGFNDLFSFPNPVDYPRQRRNDERHRIVSNFIVDLPVLWGTQLSGLLTLGSGTRYDIGDRFGGNFQPGAGEPEQESFIIPNAFGFRNLDLRLRKDFLQIGASEAAFSIDVFNVFNFQNYGCYPNIANPNDPNFGVPGCVISDPRYVQLGIEYEFGRDRIR